MRISDWSSDVCSSDLIDRGTVLMASGKIVAVGANVDLPAGVRVVDGTGKWVTPGIIDAHSHLGVFAAPGVQGHADGNENIDPYTAHVWAEHSLWPQDPDRKSTRLNSRH